MIEIEQIKFIGRELDRPECVLVTQAGNIYTSDFRGGITHITASGEQFFYGGITIEGDEKLKPNGIALLKDGSFLAAHLGDNRGGVYRVERNNNITPYLTSIDNIPLPPTNFVYLDHQQRLWITVSTRTQPRADAYRADVRNGFIIVVDKDGAKIVADNIGYTNEVYVPPSGDVLFVNATFSRELIRYKISENNTLHSPKTVCHFGTGIYPDGLTMDVEGYLWVSSIVSNRLLRINPHNGQQDIIVDDSDPEFIDWVEQAYQHNTMSREHLTQIKSRKLANISSLAFGGNDLSTMYLGCLLGKEVAIVTPAAHSGLNNLAILPIAGQAPAHWEFDN